MRAARTVAAHSWGDISGAKLAGAGAGIRSVEYSVSLLMTRPRPGIIPRTRGGRVNGSQPRQLSDLPGWREQGRHDDVDFISDGAPKLLHDADGVIDRAKATAISTVRRKLSRRSPSASGSPSARARTWLVPR